MKNKIYLLIAILLLNSGSSVIYFIKHIVEHNSFHMSYQWAILSAIGNVAIALAIFIYYAMKQIKSYKNH